MDADRVSRSLMRIAHEILERNRGIESLALVGIRARGVPLAARLAAHLKDVAGVDVPIGSLDITLYRDDLMRTPVGPQPVIRRTEIPFSIDGRHILLVDDVLYTGRTIRAALARSSIGRPSAIQLVVLVDRGHRELPIRADYVGRNIPTSRQQSVQVRLVETTAGMRWRWKDDAGHSPSQPAPARHRRRGTGRDRADSRHGAGDEGK
jgi:pyrimidine operon attenuation protein/uracil phosphoribosyltransferase